MNGLILVLVACLPLSAACGSHLKRVSEASGTVPVGNTVHTPESLTRQPHCVSYHADRLPTISACGAFAGGMLTPVPRESVDPTEGHLSHDWGVYTVSASSVGGWSVGAGFHYAQEAIVDEIQEFLLSPGCLDDPALAQAKAHCARSSDSEALVYKAHIGCARVQWQGSANVNAPIVSASAFAEQGRAIGSGIFATVESPNNPRAIDSQCQRRTVVAVEVLSRRRVCAAIANEEAARLRHGGRRCADPPAAPPGTRSADPGEVVAPPEGHQCRACDNMREALENVSVKAHTLTENSDYRFDDTAHAIMGAFVMDGGSVDFYREFEAGTEYLFIGGGSSTARDVDLAIFDEDGDSVVSDTETDPTPIIRFVPPTTGLYRLVLKMHDAHNGAFAVVASLRNGVGYSVPWSNIATSLGTVLSRVAMYSAMISAETDYQGLLFHEAPGDWCLMGRVMPPKASTQVDGFDLEPGHNVVLADTDTLQPDIDLFVYSSSGDEVAKDDDADAAPVVQFGTDQHETHSVRVVNHGDTASLVTFAVLKAEE